LRSPLFLGCLLLIVAVCPLPVGANSTQLRSQETRPNGYAAAHECRFAETNLQADNASLAAVSAGSAQDVWTVGFHSSAPTTTSPFAAHYDGTTWTATPVPGHSGLYVENGLASVAQWANGQAIAVGSYQEPKGSGFTIVTTAARWNGSTWVSTPTHARGRLYGVTTSSATEAYAVGYATPAEHALVEHWDGSTWSIVKTPLPAGAQFSALDAVAAISASDVWAVGSYNTSSTQFPLILHYDGTSWSIARTPKVTGGELLSISVVASNHSLFAAGFTSTSSQYGAASLIMAWRGAGWHVQPSVNQRATFLDSIAALSGTDAIAVGTATDAQNAQVGWVESYDGSAWGAGTVKLPHSFFHLSINGVTTVPGSRSYLAVGAAFAGSTVVPLVAHCT
jgi:hypothetical protein